MSVLTIEDIEHNPESKVDTNPDNNIQTKGIKIIFDGYGEKEDGSENINILTFEYSQGRSMEV